ncbi:uncharacterized protein cp110 isoform X2 [Brachyhypopomus gauderio]|uniref:uncharacterized protein cp110 isoform X2 n=1 Tax=Brachyhypopomus gauderio TaxID=698409 RepID=UPI004042E28B
MENYEEFIQRQINQINNCQKIEQAVSRWSSKIRFYGVPVLPPLLNKDQKEQMQRFRDASARVNRKKMISVSRMSCVQAFLNSVEVRKAPTFAEFKNETGATPFTSPSHNTECHSFLNIPGSKVDCNETKESHWNSVVPSVFPSTQETSVEDVQITPSHAFASTACDDHMSLNLRPFQSDESFQNSHKSVQFEEVPFFRSRPEKAVVINADYELDSQALSHSGKCPVRDVSYQALSSGYITNETSYINSTLAEGAAITSEGTEGRDSDFGSFFLNSSNMSHKVSDIISHAPVDGEVLEEECPASSQAPDAAEPGRPSVEADPADGPYRTSLQNLLKKSQEHRRRQRLLRNQAKSQSACEIRHADSHSLSDKENEEVLPVGTGKPELKRNCEKRKDQGKPALQVKISSQDGQTHTQVGGEEIVGPCELVSHVESTGVAQYEVPLNSCLNVTSSSNTSRMSGKILPPDVEPQSILAVAPTSAKSLYQFKGKKARSMLPRPCLTVGKKFKNIPTPKFCLSPVRSKKVSVVSSPARKPLVKTALRVDEAASGPCGPGRDTGGCVPVRVDETRPLSASVHQAEQIAQLELNLSSLKLLISDLESTLRESQADDPHETAEVGNGGVGPPADGGKTVCAVAFSTAARKEVSGEDRGTQRLGKEREAPHSTTSLLQKKRAPEAFGTVDDSKLRPGRVPVLADSSIQPEHRKEESETTEGSLNGSSLNRSYDVDTPSGLWCQAAEPLEKQRTPELGGQEGVSRAKRRLIMNAEEGGASGRQGDEGRAQASTPKTLQPRKELTPQVPDLWEERRQREEPRKAHGPQVPDQEQELLQALAARFQFLRSVSFPCSAVGSRLEDTATSAPPSSVSACLASPPRPGESVLPEASVLSGDVAQSRSCLPVRYRPLVAAAVKGYLTRRLFSTERVAQLLRTIKDTQVFLQSQTPGREYSSRPDQLLQERVTSQLRSARYELHDLFSLSPAERMQVIRRDRQLIRERELRHKTLSFKNLMHAPLCEFAVI